MTYKSYKELGYPRSIKRLFYKKYWSRKLYELRNLVRLMNESGIRSISIRQRIKWRNLYRADKLPCYSQFGEDLIFYYLWTVFFDRSPTFRYLDIGAHHPTELSNTKLLYDHGLRGINIEPDPVLFERFTKERPDDINLNVGIATEKENEKPDFYIMSTPGLNTFSKQLAEEAVRKDQRRPESERLGIRIEKVVQVPVRTILSILKEYGRERFDCVSIDAEGLDYSILTQWNFDLCRPAIFCIETDKKDTGDRIRRLLLSKSYYIFDRTTANTIFLDNNYRKPFSFYFYEYFFPR